MSFASLQSRVNKQVFAKLGEPALISVTVGVAADVSGYTVQATFDNAFLASLEVESSNPILAVNTTDVSSIKHGTSVIFNTVYYTVIGIHPTGDGVIVLELEKV